LNRLVINFRNIGCFEKYCSNQAEEETPQKR
jgi:hypothetical protein